MFLIKMCLTKKVYSRRGQTSTSTNDPQEYQIYQDRCPTVTNNVVIDLDSLTYACVHCKLD